MNESATSVEQKHSSGSTPDSRQISYGSRKSCCRCESSEKEIENHLKEETKHHQGVNTMKPTTEGVAMTETKQKNEPQPSTRFRKTVTGGSHILLITVLLLAALCVADAADVEVLHRSVIFRHTGSDPKDPANTSGMNHAPNVVLLPDGRLMAAWFSCPFERSPQQRIVHSFSSDQGRTWSAVVTLQDFEGRADFDPSFVVAGAETFMFFSVFSVDNPLRLHYRRSGDSGRTWCVPIETGQTNHTSRANGIRLATGELLVPLHMRGTKAGGVLKSRDGGKTWTRFGVVANPKGQGGEPTIAELRSGKVLMLLRTRDGEVWRSVSADKGETWSAPEKTGLPGAASSHHLLRTRDGTLVLTHNPSKPPLRFPLTMRLSRDDGATWREPVILADRPENVAGWQVSYPSAVELSDGTVVTVWTQIRTANGMVHGDIHTARVTLRREGSAVPNTR
jgi:alpha-L-rhamnosidase